VLLFGLFGLPSVTGNYFKSFISDTNISSGTLANFDKIEINSGVDSKRIIPATD